METNQDQGTGRTAAEHVDDHPHIRQLREVGAQGSADDQAQRARVLCKLTNKKV